MVSYEVDPEILRPYCPTGTQVDLYDDKAYVSVVGFRFKNTKIKGWRALFHQDFLEVNLRFYVRGTLRDTGENLKGVVFIKETASRFLASFFARLIFGEPFVTRKIAHLAGKQGVAYSILDSGDWRSMIVYGKAQAREEYSRPKPGGLTEFLMDRKVAFAKKKWREGTDVYIIEKENNWRFVKGQAEMRGIEKMYPPEFAPFFKEAPANAIIVNGGDVAVSKRYTFRGREY